MSASPFEVYIRFRPTVKQADTIIVEPNGQNISIVNPINKQKLPFTFNEILQNSSQEDVYTKICAKQVQNVLDGYCSCIMAAGQTSAGKSYSIVGDEALTYKTRGLASRALERIFQAADTAPGISFEIRFAAIEILNEKLIDLLQNQSKQKFQEPPHILEQNGKQTIKNLNYLQIHNVSEGLELLFSAEKSRTVGSSSLNSTSSRSHVIYIISVKQASRTDDAAAAVEGQFYLVDLAGSEKSGSDSSSSFINKSLSTLQQCISGLAQSAVHIPFRQSKLTHILQKCLDGQSKTALVGCVRPDPEFVLETISTLRFCQQAINVKSDATVNYIGRLMEQGGNQRKTNSQIAAAVSEALDAQGGLGQLQAKVMRQLEDENKKLKQEILLVTGAEARFEASEQDSLKKALDAWLCDAAKLPDMESRSDYVFSLNYVKQRFQNKQENRMSASPEQILPQLSETKAHPSSRQLQPNQQQAQQQLSFGTVTDKGSLSIKTNNQTLTMATSLNKQVLQQQSMQLSTHLSESLNASSSQYDEHAKFEKFKQSPDGQQLAKDLQSARGVSKSLREEMKQDQEQITKISQEIVQFQQQLIEISKQLDDNTQKQNIANFQKNQTQSQKISEMEVIKQQIEQNTNKITNLHKQLDEVKNNIELQKVQEEHTRRKMVTSFEAYCAGLHKKVLNNEDGGDDDLTYTNILNRNKKTRKV